MSHEIWKHGKASSIALLCGFEINIALLCQFVNDSLKDIC